MVGRGKFSSAFKSKVALAALKERETLAELSVRLEVSQDGRGCATDNIWIERFWPTTTAPKRIAPLTTSRLACPDLRLSYGVAARHACDNKNRASIVESSKKALQNTKKATQRIA